MQKSDHLENSLEVYESKKVFAFKGLIVSFIIWQLGQIMLNNFAVNLPSFITMIFQVFYLFGAVGWAGFSFYLIKITGFLKGNSSLIHQVNDERISLIRLRAMSYGFIITLGGTALFFGASTLIDSFSESLEISGTFVAQSILLIAVSSALISYLILDNEE